jgi:hypothetical protein
MEAFQIHRTLFVRSNLDRDTALNDEFGGHFVNTLAHVFVDLPKNAVISPSVYA